MDFMLITTVYDTKEMQNNELEFKLIVSTIEMYLYVLSE